MTWENYLFSDSLYAVSNWGLLRTITSEYQNYIDFPVSRTSKFYSSNGSRGMKYAIKELS